MATMTGNAAGHTAMPGSLFFSACQSAYSRLRQEWERRRTIRLLSALDDRMLKDIGLDRSMIHSAASGRQSAL